MLLMLVMFLPASFQGVYAAFPVKGKTASAALASTVHPTQQGHSLRAWKTLKRFVQAPDGEKVYKKQGWPGIVSLVLAVLALPFYATALIGGFAICALGAVIFGAIGLNRRKYSNNGLAIAGFVAGLVEVLLVLLLAIVIAAFLV